MADQRLQAVHDAAGFLFNKNGYANTQVSQIAEKANIATGTIYNLFSGKKSILHFVILATFDKNYLQGDIKLPVKEVDSEILIKYLYQILDKLFSKIERENNSGKVTISFTEMLSIIYDYAFKYQIAFNLISKNWDVLEKEYKSYMQCIDKLYEVIEENMAYYMEIGEVRKVEEVSLHIRNILEGITWWSMYLPYFHPDVQLPKNKAKKIGMDILTHAYLVNPE